MAGPEKQDEPPREVLAELTALADGTLDAERAAALRRQIAGSPELSKRYDRERHAVAALAMVRAERAPAGLRARIENERRRRSRAPLPRLRTAWGAAAVAALAAAALALALLLPAGTPGGPSVSEAASLAVRGSAMAAPVPGGPVPGSLNQDVEDIYFPDWSQRFGWSAAGQRVDEIGGRKAVTVYYSRGGQRIAYTIVTAPALKLPQASGTRLLGTSFQSFSSGERQVVTWRRGGHTCVLSGVGVSQDQLLRLASYRLPPAAA